MHPVNVRATARKMVRAASSKRNLKRRHREFLSDAIQALEPRQLLSASASSAHSHVRMQSTRKVFIPPGQTHPLYSVGPVGYVPSKVRAAYGIDQITFNSGSVVGDGTGQTIAIVDAYDNPSFVSSTDPNFANSDLAKFDAALGIADPPSFRKVNQSGGTSYPAGDLGWGGEIALDVEWAHALAPKANIILVECASSFDSDLFAGVRWAAAQPGVSVISMSWGGGEFSTESGSDSTFTTPSGHAGVTFVASTGDSGAPGGYPAYSPNVLAVGGTGLSLNANTGAWVSESGWSGSGGGISSYESKPSYQSSVTQSSTKRTIPDIAFDANPNTGVAVYDSYNEGTAAPWEQVGGTSLSAPCWAALIAIANQGRALRGTATFSNQQAMTSLYGLPATDFHDITTGSNGNAASVGYDLVTGLGSPRANLLVPDLAGQTVSLPAAPSAPHLANGYDTGVSSTDNITNINTPTFTGTAAASTSIKIYSDGTQVGSGTTNAAGTWSVTAFGIPDGTHTITATATNGGGTSPASSPLTLTIDTVAPTLTNTPALAYLTAPQNIQYSFSENLTSTLTTSSLTLVNTTTAQTFAAASMAVSWSGNTATYTFTTGNPGGALPDGNYTATLNVTDLAGNPLIGNNVLNFFWLTGDANHDRTVDTLDFNALAGNFGGTGKDWSQADFNYDGVVDTLDFNTLAGQFGKSIPADSSSPSSSPSSIAAAAPAATSSPSKDLFSDVTIERNAVDLLSA